ncbi:response regulator [candidate division WOR-3 bacterium]|uniref:Response regulator n=1 Tax=candidate division WOR-3 bacterium TaxID=2052148 RepID=A0A9D5K901_UNCW3|nr:response regulator [candidate division WOR-3 bacterium]MBD3364547.1 response regulator [candidate division WOR-3 bacterium]
MKDKRILVVDDEKRARELISRILTDEAAIPLTASNGREALKAIKTDGPDLVILDLMLPDINGLEVLERITTANPDMPVILVSAHGDVESAVRAVKLGAYDFIEKPIDIDRLVVACRNALWQLDLQEELTRLKMEVGSHYRMVGSSKVMRKMRERLQEAASTNAHVLILGETGSGKDLVARGIHNLSVRSNGPFVKLNCAAIPHDLVESELFGYKKGAFTGAHTDKQGRIEAAHEGTLFFDEVAELNLESQAKLLHFLESASIGRLGETKTREVDVRVVAATNNDLKEAIKQGKFRQDLYYRLNVIDIHVPPLRKHREDIPELVEYFLGNTCRELGVPTKTIEKAALRKLTSLSWPGNIRQLRNTIEKMASVSRKQILTVEDLSVIGEDTEAVDEYSKRLTLQEWRSQSERRFILQVLKFNNWNVSLTAKKLNVNRTHLHRKMKELGIEKPE